MRAFRVLAGVRLRQGRAREALEYLENARAQSDRVHDAERHLDAAAIRIQLATAAFALGDVDRARAEIAAAAAIHATHETVPARQSDAVRTLRAQIEAAQVDPPQP